MVHTASPVMPRPGNLNCNTTEFGNKPEGGNIMFCRSLNDGCHCEEAEGRRSNLNRSKMEIATAYKTGLAMTNSEFPLLQPFDSAQDRLRGNDRRLRSAERFLELFIVHTQSYINSAERPIDIVQRMDRTAAAFIH